MGRLQLGRYAQHPCAQPSELTAAQGQAGLSVRDCLHLASAATTCTAATARQDPKFFLSPALLRRSHVAAFPPSAAPRPTTHSQVPKPRTEHAVRATAPGTGTRATLKQADPASCAAAYHPRTGPSPPLPSPALHECQQEMPKLHRRPSPRRRHGTQCSGALALALRPRPAAVWGCAVTRPTSWGALTAVVEKRHRWTLGTLWPHHAFACRRQPVQPAPQPTQKAARRPRSQPRSQRPAPWLGGHAVLRCKADFSFFSLLSVHKQKLCRWAAPASPQPQAHSSRLHWTLTASCVWVQPVAAGSATHCHPCWICQLFISRFFASFLWLHRACPSHHSFLMSTPQNTQKQGCKTPATDL